MHSFIANLRSDNLRFQVHFDQYYAPDGVRYLVNVRSRNGDSSYFIMKKHTDDWRIVNSQIVSELFLGFEKWFSDAIMSYQKNKHRS